MYDYANVCVNGQLAMNRRPLYKQLYVQVLMGIGLAIALGALQPSWATAMQPLGDGFVRLITMLLTPVVFCIVVSGIGGMKNARKVGRVGVKALLYFEIVSTVALGLGLLVANLVRPGAGLDAHLDATDSSRVADYAATAKHHSLVDFLLNIIPTTVVKAFADGEILQVMLCAILVGLALVALGERANRVREFIDQSSEIVFRILDMIMMLAPIGAFGAMAATVGKFGLAALMPLAKLIITYWVTSLLFIAVVVGPIAHYAGLNLARFLRYIFEEILIILSTSNSMAVLPRLMTKLERLGCSKPLVGLVVPLGYSFNLDGTNIYMTLAALFIAQATHTDLTLTQQLTLLAVAMLTSKGSAGFAGAGFVTLAATIAVVPTIPMSGLALLVGIDRFMSMCRGLTNYIGNGVATVVVAAWEGELDRGRLEAELGHDAGRRSATAARSATAGGTEEPRQQPATETLP